MKGAGAVVLALALGGCGAAPGPAELDTRHEPCGSCRMTVSDPRFAGQIVAPGEEPVFFDDVGCLASYLAGHGGRPKDAVAYVADHRTKAWVVASRAVYMRVPNVQTPMNSHLVAHASADSQRADAAASGGVAVPVAEVFGPAGPPGGARVP